MKTVISCLALLAFVSLGAATVDNNTANFMLGTWYSTAIPSNLNTSLCCLPYGTIHIQSDVYHGVQDPINLTATNWGGLACSKLRITPDFAMPVLYENSSSINEIFVRNFDDEANYLSIRF